MKKYRLINCLDSSFSSWIWVMQNVIGLSEEQIEEILKQKIIEKKLFAEK